MSRFIMRANCHPFFSVLIFENNGRSVSIKKGLLRDFLDDNFHGFDSAFFLRLLFS